MHKVLILTKMYITCLNCFQISEHSHGPSSDSELVKHLKSIIKVTHFQFSFYISQLVAMRELVIKNNIRMDRLYSRIRGLNFLHNWKRISRV